MITQNHSPGYGQYRSILKEYAAATFHHDGSRLIFTGRYGAPRFTITHPDTRYRNCEMVQGYPHFTIPKEIRQQEVENFIAQKPLYTENFCIRFGDTHPDKLLPKLGQMRNILLGDLFASMLTTEGSVRKIYAVGDISEKSIHRYACDTGLSLTDEHTILGQLLCPHGSEEPVVKAYRRDCQEKIQLALYPFLQEFHIDAEILLESELYRQEDFFRSIAEAPGAQKENGNLYYDHQELMFLLHPRFHEDSILNILGDDQSDHVQKVLNLLQYKAPQKTVGFLKYGCCRNAASTDRSQWRLLLAGAAPWTEKLYLTLEEYLRILVCGAGNHAVLDFQHLGELDRMVQMLYTILSSMSASKMQRLPEAHGAEDLLLSQMALVCQELDLAIRKGEQNKFFQYLYRIAVQRQKAGQLTTEGLALYQHFQYVGLCRLCLDRLELVQKCRKELL